MSLLEIGQFGATKAVEFRPESATRVSEARGIVEIHSGSTVGLKRAVYTAPLLFRRCLNPHLLLGL